MRIASRASSSSSSSASRLSTQSYCASCTAKFFCAANPSHGWTMTRAPSPAAICTVSSVEPESTTRISSAQSSERMARATCVASLCVMIVAEMGGIFWRQIRPAGVNLQPELTLRLRLGHGMTDFATEKTARDKISARKPGRFGQSNDSFLCNFHLCKKKFTIFLGQGTGPAFVIDDNVRGLAFSQQQIVGLSVNLISEDQDAPPHSRKASLDQDFVVITGRRFVATLRLRDNDAEAVFPLHVAVFEAMLPAKLRPANLKPNEVIGVIDHAHLVRLSVADTKGCH